MSDNTNPFARRQSKFKTVEGNTVNTIAEVSTKDDTSVEENKSIEQFIPSQADPSVDEGLQKMINILNKQRLDDIRDGEQNIPQELKLPKSDAGTGVGGAQPYPAITPQMLSALGASMGGSVAAPSSPFITTTPNDVQQEDYATKDADKPKEEPKKVEYTPEDVLPLLDSIINYGYASETFNIRGNSITIRTQFYWEENAIRDAIEDNVNQDTMRVTAEALLQQYALASCLVSVGGNYFKPRNVGTPEQLRKSLAERVEFLNTLPSIIVYYINKKRGEFNDKVIYLSEHFDEVLKAF